MAASSSSTKVVELGFAEPLEESRKLERFPCKIGGRPVDMVILFERANNLLIRFAFLKILKAWLNPEHILSVEQVTCGVCETCMILLVQLYAPEDHPPEAFHRTIYVFCCKNGACHKTSWRKSQMPNENPYWPPSAAESEDNDENDSLDGKRIDLLDESSNIFSNNFTAAKQCVVCGLLGSKRCGKCHRTYYCSKEHQTVHWTIGQHRIHCNNDNADSSSSMEEYDNLCRKSILFPEFEIVSELEENMDKHDENRMDDDAFRKKEGNSRALVPVGDEIYENTQVSVDKAFLKFQKKVRPYPDQVLRYARLNYENENADPLWVSDIGKPTPEDIPPCSHCNQERTFEFQVAYFYF
ncbi:9480_t:CDS:2 [Acaulospora colombiana]|uniref:9480_t:CDS:1 n=1 Tax=Acaulospora colombiana TaxID=27376 RepID=A0ACA9KMY3_9GLOM|nr:9480_t:CDS:2 [Acaulospora colombiana]